MLDNSKIKITGHVIIKDIRTNKILVDKYNAINFENLSTVLAKGLADLPDGHIQEMEFGNGGSSVSGTGTITFLSPNITGSTAQLYNPTFIKVVNDQSPLNLDPTNNFITVNHTLGSLFSDIVVTATLDFNEPSGQAAFDNATSLEGDFVFDEIGLKSFSNTSGGGLLMSHIIFSPIQKSLNRQLLITYTLRISVS